MTPQKFNKRRPMCVLNSSESRLDSSASMKNMKKIDERFFIRKELFLFNECDGDFYRLVTLVWKCFDTSYKRRQKTDNNSHWANNKLFWYNKKQAIIKVDSIHNLVTELTVLIFWPSDEILWLGIWGVIYIPNVKYLSHCSNLRSQKGF